MPVRSIEDNSLWKVRIGTAACDSIDLIFPYLGTENGMSVYNTDRFLHSVRIYNDTNGMRIRLNVKDSINYHVSYISCHLDKEFDLKLSPAP